MRRDLALLGEKFQFCWKGDTDTTPAILSSKVKPIKENQKKQRKFDSSRSLASHAGIYKGSSLFIPSPPFVGRDERRAPLKTPAWEATRSPEPWLLTPLTNSTFFTSYLPSPSIFRACHASFATKISLRIQPFLLAPRRQGQNVLSDEEQGETAAPRLAGQQKSVRGLINACGD